MTLTPVEQAELRDLVDAVCEGELAPPVMDRLGSMLLADDDACRYYLDYFSLHGSLLLAAGPVLDVHPSSFIPHPSESQARLPRLVRQLNCRTNPDPRIPSRSSFPSSLILPRRPRHRFFPPFLRPAAGYSPTRPPRRLPV